MKYIGFDTETFPIGPGAVAPKLVCLTLASRDAKGEMQSYLYGNGDAELRDMVWQMFTAPNVTLIAHNAAYDCTVLATAYPEFESAIWAKYEAGEITDTMIREKLLNLSTHGQLDTINGGKLAYHLSDLVMKYLGRDISADKEGEDAWRLNYFQLDGRKGSEYPDEAASYAKYDAIYALLVHEQQDMLKRSETGPASFSTEFFHTAADFALKWMTIAGMTIDKEKLAEIEAMLARELTDDKLDLLIAEGIMRPAEPERIFTRQRKKACEILDCSDDDLDEMASDPEIKQALEAEGIKFKAAVASSINKAKLQAKVVDVCGAYEIPVKMTDGGESGDKQVSTDMEVIDTVADWDETLKQYQHRQQLQKLVSTEVPRMKWGGQVADVVHFNFDVLKETGRTSSFAGKLYPSGSGQQMHPLIRPCYRPRDGYLLCSSDYSSLELCSTAQTTFSMFGHSKMREVHNRGVDLHAYLGAQLALRLHADFRGLCVAKGISGDRDKVYEAFAECKKHESPQVQDFYKHWRKFAKPVGLGYPGGLGAETFIGFAKKTYKVDIVKEAGSMEQAIALAKELKAVWLDTFPEMQSYFNWVSNDAADADNSIIGYWDTEKTQPIKGLCYTSPMGMYRAAASYCAVANGKAMQTPSAEGAKAAVFMVVRACRDKSLGSPLYGSIPVNFVHDEILVEHPAETAHERAAEQERIMVEAMKLICPDVDIRANSALMLRWDKRAEPVFDAAGRLIPWTPPADAPVAVEEEPAEIS